MEYDVIIIGGSFSGLSSAYFLAQKGLKVCLFEGKRIGTFTKSTGVFTKSVIKDLNVPDILIESYISGLSIYSPNMVEYVYRFNKPLFYSSDTLNFLKWLKNLATDSNTKIIEKKFCKSIKINSSGVSCEGISGKMLVLASSLLPRYIQPLIPKDDVVYYTGMEYVTDSIKSRDRHVWEWYFDYNIAPGYATWILPSKKDRTHVGIAGKNSKFNPRKSMKKFLDKLNVKRLKIYERRSGIVPLSGPVSKTYGDRFILVGDAAGQIGSLSSAGINYSVRAAKVISKVILSCIDNPTEKNLKQYEEEWKKEFGSQLNEEVMLRKLYDRINNNEKLEIFLVLLNSLPKRKIYEILERFTNLKYMHVRRTFFPHLLNLERLKKTIQLFLH